MLLYSNMLLHRLYDAGLHKQFILFRCCYLLFCWLYRIDTLPFTPAKILLFNGSCKYVQRRFNKEDGVHIVRGVYAMLQSITKVFICIGYVSVILYAGCEEGTGKWGESQQGMSRG